MEVRRRTRRVNINIMNDTRHTIKKRVVTRMRHDPLLII